MEDREKQYCLYHKRSVGHSIQDYQHFLKLVQEMMNERVMEFCKEIKTEKGQVVNVLQRETPKSITIFYRGGGQQAPTKAPIYPIPRIVIKVPTPFQYTSDKAMSWNYKTQVISQEPQAVRVNLEEKQDPSVNDKVGTSGLTRNGRCYAPGLSGVKEGEEHIEQSGVKVTILKKKTGKSLNELITEAEANEFLKFIKHNEYSIVE